MYFYIGHVDINEHNAFDLMDMAEFLNVPSLMELSSEFISQKLSLSNCIKAHYSAESYNCPDLQQTARDFTLKNFIELTDCDEWLNLSITQVEEWISDGNLVVKAEEDVFQVVVKWMEKNERINRQSFFDLFRHVRLIYVSRNFVFYVILPHPLVKGCGTCTQFVHDAMRDPFSGTEECYFNQQPRKCLKTFEDAIIATGTRDTLCYLPSEDKWYMLSDMTSDRLSSHH